MSHAMMLYRLTDIFIKAGKAGGIHQLGNNAHQFISQTKLVY